MKSLSSFISLLNWGIKNKKLYVKVKKTKFILNVIYILVQENYLLGVKSYDKDFVLVFFKVNFRNSNALMTKIILISKCSRNFYIKVSLLQKLTGFFVLSTIKGVLSLRQAKKQNLGGKLLFKII